MFAQFSYRIIHNLFYFLLVIAISHNLGVISLGHYTFALAYAGITYLCFSFGLTELLVKDLSRNPQKIVDIVGTVLPFRLFSWLIGFSLMMILALIIIEDRVIIIIIFVVGIQLTIDSLDGALLIGFWAKEDFHIEAYTQIISVVIGLPFAIFLVLKGHGIFMALLAALAGQIVGFAVSIWFFIRRIGLPKISIDLPLWISLIRKGVPFYLSNIILLAILQLDMVMIGMMTDAKTTGLFGVPFTIVKNLSILAFYLLNVLYPGLSLLWSNDKIKFFSFAKTIIIVTSFFGILSSGILFMFSRPLSKANTLLNLA